MPTPAEPIRLGTRASQLARTQSGTVGEQLAAAAGRPWQEVLVRTQGDDTSVPLSSGRPGMFVSALRDALLAGDVDVIVHSYKDLPSAPVPGVALAAIPGRVDARDGLVSRDGTTLAGLPTGAVVGTSSPRRAAALARLRPDLVLREIRGNVDTRIAKVRSGEYDAAVLAVAGLTRIGRAGELAQVLDDVLPAPAQGALAVECRADDTALLAALAQLDDPVARLTTQAEREVLVGLGAACTTAVAAAATWDGTTLALRAELTEAGRHTSADLAVDVEASDLSGPAALLAARTLGLRAAGVLRGATPARPPVLLVRVAGDDADAAELGALGIPTVRDPYVRQSLRRGADAERLLALLGAPPRGSWLVVTSPVAVASWAAVVGADRLRVAAGAARQAGLRVAAVGERTAITLRDLGFAEVSRPPAQRSSADGLVDLLAGEEPATVLLPRGGQALETVPRVLAERGWRVETAVVYDTHPVDERPGSAPLAEAGEVAAVVLRAPSAVRALAGHARPAAEVLLVCAGETTAAAARAAGLRVDAVAADPSSSTVAATVAAILPVA